MPFDQRILCCGNHAFVYLCPLLLKGPFRDTMRHLTASSFYSQGVSSILNKYLTADALPSLKFINASGIPFKPPGTTSYG
jgi:hypothetical protein